MQPGNGRAGIGNSYPSTLDSLSKKAVKIVVKRLTLFGQGKEEISTEGTLDELKVVVCQGLTAANILPLGLEA